MCIILRKAKHHNKGPKTEPNNNNNKAEISMEDVTKKRRKKRCNYKQNTIKYNKRNRFNQKLIFFMQNKENMCLISGYNMQINLHKIIIQINKVKLICRIDWR